MFKRIRKAMAFFVFSLAYVLIFLGNKISRRKKEKDIVGFASDFFSGNVKYLYQEMENYASVKNYFVTGNKSELDRLKPSKMETYYYMDIRRIPLFLHACKLLKITIFL